MIRARVVAHSLNAATGDELVTMEWTYPRMVHAEALRHRMLSRNAASSRAIPVKRMLEAIQEDPARPVEWGTAKAGMQAGEPLEGVLAMDAEDWWTTTMEDAVRHAEEGAALNLHKQVVNRVTEPFAHITELVSGTEWGNFYRMRVSPFADPTLRALATAAARAYLASTPKVLQPGEWHIPYGEFMPEGLGEMEQAKLAIAWAAQREIEQDFAKHDELLANDHWSCFEHCAQAMEAPEPGLADRMEAAGWDRKIGEHLEESLHWCRNFRGFRQYRDMVDKTSTKRMYPADLHALVEEHGYPGY